MIKNSVAILLALFCFVVLGNHIKPSVSIYNNSGDVIHLYKGTGEKNVEPDIEQAESSMRPVLIRDDENEKIILSWRDLNLNNGQLYLGWDVKKQKNQLILLVVVVFSILLQVSVIVHIIFTLDMKVKRLNH